MNWAAILVVMKLTKIGVFLSAIALIAIGKATPSYAGATCTPGIPCTGYDINATPGAATNQSYNAWKSGGLPSDAPPFTNTSCDGNYMNQMIGEAFIHAQREVAMNAQIIRKPDSVLEYTCFDRYVAHAANFGRPSCGSQGIESCIGCRHFETAVFLHFTKNIDRDISCSTDRYQKLIGQKSISVGKPAPQ